MRYSLDSVGDTNVDAWMHIVAYGMSEIEYVREDQTNMAGDSKEFYSRM